MVWVVFSWRFLWPGAFGVWYTRYVNILLIVVSARVLVPRGPSEALQGMYRVARCLWVLVWGSWRCYLRRGGIRRSGVWDVTEDVVAATCRVGINSCYCRALVPRGPSEALRVCLQYMIQFW